VNLDKIGGTEAMAEISDKRDRNKQDEAERIYRAIFRKAIPELVRERYYRAAEILFSRLPPEEDQIYQDVMNKVHDLEAVEIAARRENKMPLLVFRFRLMVHLAENLPADQHIFFNSSDRKIPSYFSLLFGGARTLYKTLKGRLLLRRIEGV
jgi:hypothetical protein